jgi:hypothetical protein
MGEVIIIDAPPAGATTLSVTLVGAGGSGGAALVVPANPELLPLPLNGPVISGGQGGGSGSEIAANIAVASITFPLTLNLGIAPALGGDGGRTTLTDSTVIISGNTGVGLNAAGGKAGAQNVNQSLIPPAPTPVGGKGQYGGGGAGAGAPADVIPAPAIILSVIAPGVGSFEDGLPSTPATIPFGVSGSGGNGGGLYGGIGGNGYVLNVISLGIPASTGGGGGGQAPGPLQTTSSLVLTSPFQSGGNGGNIAADPTETMDATNGVLGGGGGGAGGTLTPSPVAGPIGLGGNGYGILTWY